MSKRGPGAYTREEKCSPGRSRVHRVGVSQPQKAKVSGDERPRLRASYRVAPTFLFSLPIKWDRILVGGAKLVNRRAFPIKRRDIQAIGEYSVNGLNVALIRYGGYLTGTLTFKSPLMRSPNNLITDVLNTKQYYFRLAVIAGSEDCCDLNPNDMCS